ncbi:MAG: PAS domain-containing protein [Verrucomicrobia bacterium]|nr:PAS domain-containing protein [Verrucomicrobiota bacterium]
MKTPPPILIHTRDPQLRQRLLAIAHSGAEPYLSETREDLENACSRLAPAILLLDLRLGEPAHALPDFLRRYPNLAVIALGDPRSIPAQIAESCGVYALESLDTDRRHLANLLSRALDFLQMRMENERLKSEAQRSRPAAESRASRDEETLSLRHLARALNHLGDINAMFDRIVEGIASATKVVRAGIFVQRQPGEPYRLAAALRCTGEVAKLSYPATDTFVLWMDRHAHLVARSTLEAIADHADRALLQRNLDAQTAEIIAPLHARGRMIGWILIGHRATGLPFQYADLEAISSAVGHISTALENAILYEEVTRQKSLAETLIHSLPTGIVAADEQGVIRWFSTAAQTLLALAPERAVGQSIEVLGSRLADMVRRTIEGELFEFPQAWTDPLTRRAMYVQTRRLGDATKCLGAVAIIQDITAQRALQEKQEQLERAAFWNELAASMSHEIRNPLVAIKTFAQLLPERYNDADFRTEFSQLVSAEVDRLNGIIDQINDFAHPPELKYCAFDIRQPLRRSVENVLPSERRNGTHLSVKLDDNLPPVWGDERAITDCFAHLLRNSLEALPAHGKGQIELIATRPQSANHDKGVAITVRDNGKGIPPDIREKIFSPFCTTKARGMGLGLSIVKRTVVDHNGRVEINSSDRGTAVTVTLPAAGLGEHS